MALLFRRVGQLTSLRGLQRTGAAAWFASRHLSAILHPPDVGNDDGADEEEGSPFPSAGEPEAVDTRYRSPTEVVWPASRKQEKFAARVRDALTRVLAGEDVFREGLIRRLGFTIKEVRMSPDNLKAYILWDSYLGKNDAVQQELDRRLSRLRSAMGATLGARHVPRLEFRHDHLTSQQAEVEHVFSKLEEERMVEQQASLWGQRLSKGITEYSSEEELPQEDLEGVLAPSHKEAASQGGQPNEEGAGAAATQGGKKGQAQGS